MSTLLMSFILGIGPNVKPITPQVVKIEFVAEQIQPELSQQDALKLAFAVDEASSRYHFQWETLLAILVQESTLLKDPGHCLAAHHYCRDYGVAQINYHTWGVAMNLSKRQLVTSYQYSLNTQAKILSLYREHYKDWVGRYHSFTPELRVDYEQRVRRHYAKIKKILRKFKNERHSKITRYFANKNQGQRSAGICFRRNPGVVRVFDRPRRSVLRTLQS